MKSIVINFNTQDGGKISGIFYSSSPKKRIVLIIHGACMNFLEGISSFVPSLTKSYDEYDFFSINMRAHDIGYIVNNYKSKEGWAWQSIEKNRQDILAMYHFFSGRGYENIVLCGHSWGGLVCMDCLMNFQLKNISNLILLSPATSFKLLAEVNYRDDLSAVVVKAKELISHGMAGAIIPTNNKAPIPFMSAKTIMDFIGSDFEPQNFLKSVMIYTDIIVGGLEHKKLQDFSESLPKLNPCIKSHIIEKVNHFYTGKENEIVNLIDSILGR